MNEGLISKRYAKALLEYATTLGEDHALYKRMKTLEHSLFTTPGLREVLRSPVVSTEDKAELISTASGGGKFEQSGQRFVRLVLRNGRGDLMQYMVLSYILLYREVNKISVVELVTAFPLSDKAIERIRLDVERRTHGTVEFEMRVDPSIEGGAIFRIDDLRLDASVAGQLEKVRRQFIQKNRIIV